MSDTVQVDLGDNGGLVVLREKADAIRIVESERSKWDWLFSLADRDGNFESLRNTFRSAWQDLEQTIARESALDSMAERLKTRFVRDYSPGAFIFHSANPFSIFVGTQSKFDLEENHSARISADLRNAGLMLAYGLNVSVGNQDDQARDRARFEYLLWQFGIHENRPEKVKVDRFLDQSRNEVSKDLKTFDEANEKIGHLVSARQQASIDESNRHNDLVDQHEKKMQEIEEAFRKRMSLEAPVKLWKDRASRHGWAAAGWGCASLAAVGGVGAIVIRFAKDIFPDPVDRIMALKSAMQITDAAAGSVATQLLIAAAAKFAVIVLFCVWVIRVFVRNYMSQSHLATDASERGAVIESFMSMSADEKLRTLKVLEDKGFPMALERAFGKAADGIVRDDGMPSVGPIDAVKNLLK